MSAVPADNGTTYPSKLPALSAGRYSPWVSGYPLNVPDAVTADMSPHDAIQSKPTVEMRRPCVQCGQLTHQRPRCSTCETSREGYGYQHQQARATLRALLPAPCGYCQRILTHTDDWVAAHKVDGHAEYGYLIACRLCNERAKRNDH